MSDPDGTRSWPFSSKKERKPSRSSALVFIALVYERSRDDHRRPSSRARSN
jgi:hypothetical protein